VPKRTFWLVTGAAVGAGTSLWAERKLRRSVQQAAARLQPDALVAEMGRSARQAAGTAGDRVRGAVASGRDEMQRREEALWADLASQGVERAHGGKPPLASVTDAPSGRGGATGPSGTSRPRLPLHLGN
jgi:hypothetical protein